MSRPLRKDPTLAVVLGLFGPVGVLYASVPQGLLAIPLCLVLWCAGGLPGVVAWLACPVWAYLAAGAHNRRIDAAEALAVRKPLPVATPGPPCSKCSTPALSPASRFCVRCGTPLP